MEDSSNNEEFPLLQANKVYTVDTLARALKLSELTIKRKAMSGEIPCRKAWKRYYFYGADVMKAIIKRGEKKGDPSDWEL